MISYIWHLRGWVRGYFKKNFRNENKKAEAV
jgi:hypothetical protein